MKRRFILMLFSVVFSWSGNVFALTTGPSVFPHTVDGYFTGLEWSDIAHHTGTRSFVYYDTTAPAPDGSFKFYLMNDWVNLTLRLSSTESQLFTIKYGSDTWNMQVTGFPPSPVTTTIIPDDGRWYDGAAGFGISPNSTIPHAMWEIGIEMEGYDPVKPIWVFISDPYTPGTLPQPDEAFVNGFDVWPLPGGGSDSVVVPAPTALLLVSSGLASWIGFGRKRLFGKA